MPSRFWGAEKERILTIFRLNTQKLSPAEFNPWKAIKPDSHKSINIKYDR